MLKESIRLEGEDKGSIFLMDPELLYASACGPVPHTLFR